MYSIKKIAEAIIITASGCGAMVLDYGELLKNDSDYADKAKRVSELAKDLSEAITVADIKNLSFKRSTTTTAVHYPCSLQHASKLSDSVKSLLNAAGLTTKRKINLFVVAMKVLIPSYNPNLVVND